MEVTDDFVPVEFGEPAAHHGRFFVDSAPPRSILAVFLVLALFIGIHVAVAWRAPKIITYTDDRFALREGEGNASIDLDLAYSQLDELHRFLDVNCTVVKRVPSSRNVGLDVDIGSRSVFLKNETVVNSVSSKPQTVKIEFLGGSKTSSSFTIMHREVHDYDSVRLRLTITTDFESIEAFAFRSSFANPSAFAFSKAARIFLALLLGYMLVVYLSFLSFDEEIFTELFCILLGVTGILACNPLTLFLRSGESARLSDHVFLAAFVALFRMFLLLQLELIRGRSASPNVLLVFLAAVFFCGYATVDAGASFDRALLFADAETERMIVLPTEALFIDFDIAYTVVFGLWLFLALIHSRGFAGKRLFVVAALTVVGMMAVVFSHLVCVRTAAFAYTLLPTMVYSTVHMVAAAFALFFLHSDGEPHYKPILAGEESLEIADEISSGDAIEEGFAE
jgi:hypothetical protein